MSLLTLLWIPFIGLRLTHNFIRLQTSEKLKLKIRDRNSFGLFKCQAKNEIGIQQRACLYQVVEARAPKLRHSCHFQSASSISIQVNCEPIDHLKTEDFEISSRSTGSDSSSWPQLGLEAANSSATQLQNYQLPDGRRMRIVYPPRWLLIELYKIPTDSSNINELVSYIIVANASQLNEIKSIVESSQMFKSNPKSVYYVMARNWDAYKEDKSRATNYMESSMLNFRPDIQSFKTNSKSDDSVDLDLLYQQVDDPSIRLASHFSFTIPSLEPKTKYKLMIFAQNLANKTRDWLVLKGETLTEDELGKQRDQLIDGTTSSEVMNSRKESESTNQAPQKSLVMRSDSDQQADPPSWSDRNSSENKTWQDSWMSTGFPIGLDSRWTHKLQSYLTNYTDRAIGYTKQKPLVAFPILLLCSISLLFTLIWFVGHLGHIVRRRGSPNRRRHGSQSSPSSDSTNKSSVVTNEIHPNGIGQHYHGSQHDLDRGKPIVFTTSSSANSHSMSAYSALSSVPPELMPLGDSNDRGASVFVASTQLDPQIPSELLRVDQHRQYWAGSLDRRPLAHHPIYVTTSNDDFGHHLSDQFGHRTTDRAHWELSDVATSNLLHRRRTIKSGNGRIGGQTGRPSQRVAFNLSPYDDQHHQHDNQTQNQNQLELVHRHGICKGSDSSGSNSNNTADSGHESPPTNGTSTTTGTVTTNAAPTKNVQQMSKLASSQGGYILQSSEDSQFQPMTLASSIGSSVACSPATSELIHLQASVDGNQMQLSNESDGLLMLMESPSDSIGLPINLTHLQNNHRMATSFCGASSEVGKLQVNSLEPELMYYIQNHSHIHHHRQTQRQQRANGQSGARDEDSRDVENWL